MSEKEIVPVTQADREMAASMMDIQGGPNTMPSYVRMGREDDHPVVQAFARHRLASTPSPDAILTRGMEEADAEVERIMAMSDEEIMAEATPAGLAGAARMKREIDRMLRVARAAFTRGKLEGLEEAAKVAEEEAAEAPEPDGVKQGSVAASYNAAWRSTACRIAAAIRARAAALSPSPAPSEEPSHGH